MRFFRTKKTAAAERPANAFDDPSSIGNILVHLGRVTPQELYAAIGQQAQFNDALLGTLLCQRGVTTNADIARALEIQQKMRSGNELQAELDILEAKLFEAADSGRELSKAIETKRTERQEKHGRPEIFLVPVAAAVRGT
jgi:hypothetical protein